MSKNRVAIVGAGISGLSCARVLKQNNKNNFDITIFDKSRGTGGRLATRRTQYLSSLNNSSSQQQKQQKQLLQFDHGAQYFTVRNNTFNTFVEECVTNGAAAEWKGRIISLGERSAKLKDSGSLSYASATQHDSSLQKKSHQSPRRYVGIPAMNSIVKYIATSTNLESRIHHNVRIDSISQKYNEKQNDENSSPTIEWELKDNQGESMGVFDRVVMALPAPQAASLLHTIWPEASSRIASECRMAGCWCTMVAFSQPLSLPFDAAFINNSPVLSWIARNSSKPQRLTFNTNNNKNIINNNDNNNNNNTSMECWVLHAGPEWSDANIDRSKEEVESDMIQAFRNALSSYEQNIPVPPAFITTHRWRYASVPKPLDDPYLFDAERGIGVCGDWCGGPRVEGAFLSGLKLAQAIVSNK